jgi:hypothetical protein
MKIRLGFISNSSESSFLIVGEKTDFPYKTIELTKLQKKRLVNFGCQFFPIDEKIFISEYICDCGGDDYIDFVHLEYDDSYNKIIKYTSEHSIYEFDEGRMGEDLKYLFERLDGK